jgi:hypothetical protein
MGIGCEASQPSEANTDKGISPTLDAFDPGAAMTARASPAERTA